MHSATLRTVLFLMPVLLFLPFEPVAGQTPAPKVSVEKIKYADLGKLIRGLKGKVVLVDFWAEYCLPCKKEFPHLVELHQKYGKDGLVAISVSVDDPEDLEIRGRILKFLEGRKADFQNFVLDEKPELWQEKLGIDGPPCLYLFDKSNRFVKKMIADQVDFTVLEKTIRESLNP